MTDEDTEFVRLGAPGPGDLSSWEKLSRYALAHPESESVGVDLVLAVTCPLCDDVEYPLSLDWVHEDADGNVLAQPTPAGLLLADDAKEYLAWHNATRHRDEGGGLVIADSGWNGQVQRRPLRGVWRKRDDLR